VVDRVALYNDKDSNMCIKVLTRHTRRPEVKLFLVYFNIFDQFCVLDLK
jgi:hypothetical protein